MPNSFIWFPVSIARSETMSKPGGGCGVVDVGGGPFVGFEAAAAKTVKTLPGPGGSARQRDVRSTTFDVLGDAAITPADEIAAAVVTARASAARRQRRAAARSRACACSQSSAKNASRS